ncbi:Epidermal growth factor receptor kinase substrate 8-like protein 3 [Aphelenchoides bicaudatus]|nr:Epidermal growth factor receptor kinase substrate 8-like protein 3 [Aphelenchoides bicaudatus]
MFDSANSRLPYIPPPDYTIRPKQKPKVFVEQQKRYQAKDDHGKPHHYFPEIKRQPPKPRPVSASIDEEPFEEPRSQSPEEVKHRVLRMLKEQGVPVFPTTPLKQVVEQGNAANLGPTRAYIKHLENHRKYDTLNSFRSCDNCALCKQMQKEIRLLEGGIQHRRHPQKQHIHQHAHHRHTAPQPFQPAPDYNMRSPIISGTLFEPLNEVDEPEEPPEPADLIVERNTRLNKFAHRHNLSVETHSSHSTASPPEQRRIIRVPEARARRDFQAETAQQLSVQEGEKLKVIQTDAVWSLCTTRHGQMGWVPTNNLQFEHSSSLGSSPGSLCRDVSVVVSKCLNILCILLVSL